MKQLHVAENTGRSEPDAGDLSAARDELVPSSCRFGRAAVQPGSGVRQAGSTCLHCAHVRAQLAACPVECLGGAYLYLFRGR